MTTIQRPSRKVCWCLRTISRRRRRTRLRTTALPRRLPVIRPTRGGPGFCTTRKLSSINLPRSVWPCLFIQSNSEARVKRRIFGKESERALDTSIIDLTIRNRTGGFYCTAKSLPRSTRGKTLCKVNDALNYGEGAGDVILMFVSVFVSVLVSGAGDSFMIVVSLSFVSAGGFVIVVSFCSHAISNALPTRMITYFFITVED